MRLKTIWVLHKNSNLVIMGELGFYRNVGILECEDRTKVKPVKIFLPSLRLCIY